MPICAHRSILSKYQHNADCIQWRKTTSNLLLHCSSFHVTDPQGRQRRRDRSGRTESSISLNLLSPSIESSGEWRDPGVLEPSKDNEHSGNAVTVSSSCKISEEALQDSADLYVPHDIQSNAWESFRLSRNHANRAWCIHCKVWQRVSRKTSLRASCILIVVCCECSHALLHDARRRLRTTTIPHRQRTLSYGFALNLFCVSNVPSHPSMFMRPQWAR